MCNSLKRSKFALYINLHPINEMYMVRKCVLIALCLLSLLPVRSQSQVEVFMGADLKYGDTNFKRLYDVLLHLTPGVKWHIGNDWMVAGQVFVPIVKLGYQERDKMTRLNMAVVSKQIHFAKAKQHLKLSAGLFGKERMGIDLRWMFPVNDWLLLMAQAGLTQPFQLGTDFNGNSESDFGGKWTATGLAGLKFYLNRWDTEFQLTGGRYLYEDMGAQLDVMRHFPHCTVGLYAQLHERGSGRFSNRIYGGGFKVIVMLPPYKKSKRKFVVRPASNFRLTYNAQSNVESMQMYTTDPEENERQYPVDVPFGTGREK